MKRPLVSSTGGGGGGKRQDPPKLDVGNKLDKGSVLLKALLDVSNSIY
ncbi:MAG: hypothetical protein HON90_15605 [Halobacteriovoraceae bacterium]|nr:hypothetical protein [Halobacteriovoraceae bacterium]MBT6120438.1 hypothetical protein [bacterium]